MTVGGNVVIVWSNRMLFTTPLFKILEIVNEFYKHSWLPYNVMCYMGMNFVSKHL